MKGVPLGADGKHTFVPYAATSAAIASARDSAFSSYIVLAETHATIVDGSTIKVTVPWNAAETALTFDPDECNYLRYKNDPIDNNYRYCYITNCEYVNPNTFLFTLKEDYFTTWAPYANIKECFVKRQHSPTDNVGDNVITESFDLGKLVFETPKQSIDYSIYNNCIVVLCAFSMDNDQHKFTDYTGGAYGGMYSGVTMYGFYDNPSATPAIYAIAEFRKFVNWAAYAQKAEGILGVFTMPEVVLDSTAQTFGLNIVDYPDWWIPPGGTAPWTVNIYYKDVKTALTESNNMIQVLSLPKPLSNGVQPWGYATISGKNGDYAPKNKKLFTYPYVYAIGTNKNGNEQEYRYEWSDAVAYLDVETALILGGKPELVGVPKNYLGQSKYHNGKIVSQDFVPCPYTIDSYMIYMGQYAYGGQSLKMLGEVIPGVVSLAAGGALGAVTGNQYMQGAAVEQGIATGIGALGAPINALASYNAAQNKADRLGSPANFGYMDVMDEANIALYPVHITNEKAAAIDNYFTHFGYAENRVLKPDIFNRVNYNYLETIQAQITSDIIPQPAITAMQAQLDAGITIWHTLLNVGKYDEITNNIRS